MNKRGRPKGGKNKPTEKQMAYAMRRVAHPEEPKTVSRTKAGYTRGTKPETIEKSEAYKSVSDLVEEALLMNKTSRVDIIRKSVNRLQTTIGRRGAEHDANANSAIGTLHKITGLEFPKQVDSSVKIDDSSLLAGFLER